MAHAARGPGLGRTLGVGFLAGFLLNLLGWLGNNFLLGSMWREVGEGLGENAWRDSVWRDVVSFAPDYVYGFAMAWLCVALRPRYASWLGASVACGGFVSLVGGVVTYMGIANSGFIPWKLAFASWALVLGSKLPIALMCGKMLEPRAAIERG